MKRVTVTQFRAQCLTLIDEVKTTRQPILVTKKGKPVVKLVPAGKAPKFFGRLKGIIHIVGDIESPVEPPSAWDVS
jgi:prevent-host-death family protein